MDGNDFAPLIKIEPKLEEAIDSELQGNILVSNEALVTIKNEITTTAEWSKSLDNEEVQQTDCEWNDKPQISNDYKCDIDQHTTNRPLQVTHHFKHDISDGLNCRRWVEWGNKLYIKGRSLAPKLSSNVNVLKCATCDYQSNNKYYFKLHLLNHTNSETNSKVFKCAYCDYKTKYKGNCKQHLLNHINSKDFQCADCNYKTHNKYYFNRHLLIHTGSKNFKCGYCNYKTNNKLYLNLHLFNHTDSKNFKCANCDYETNNKYYFNIHCLKHKVSKEFKCGYCNYETRYKSYLKQHLLRHTPFLQGTNYLFT
ncbi:RE1-silencing transcription factor-like [Photinus pyralis]|nr:RE1-silencing transcription factor-like [Photinus pyralis]